MALNRAIADVAFSDRPRRHVEKVRLDLMRSSDLWKFHDIGMKGRPSLLAYLRDYKY